MGWFSKVTMIVSFFQNKGACFPSSREVVEQYTMKGTFVSRVYAGTARSPTMFIFVTCGLATTCPWARYSSIVWHLHT
jgi:hypothetical protein